MTGYEQENPNYRDDPIGDPVGLVQGLHDSWSAGLDAVLAESGADQAVLDTVRGLALEQRSLLFRILNWAAQIEAQQRSIQFRQRFYTDPTAEPDGSVSVNYPSGIDGVLLEVSFA